MKRLFRKLHNNQRGLVISGMIAFIIAAILSATATFALLDRLQWGIDNTETATPQLPDRAQGYEWVAWGCTEDSGTPASQMNADWGIVVCPANTIEIEEFDWRIGRISNGDREWEIQVWTWANATGLDTRVGSSLIVSHNALPASPGVNQVQPWCTFTFSDRIVMYAGTWYTIRLKLVSGSTGNQYTTIPYGAACLGAVTKGYFVDSPSNGWHDDKESDYMVKGYISAEPTVDTIGHEFNLDGSVQLYGSVDPIGDMTCGFLVSDDYDYVVAGNGQDYEADQTGWYSGTYLFDYRLSALVTNTSYSYRSYASAYGQTWLGPVLNFTRTAADVPLQLRCDVIENSLNQVRFESAVAGIDTSAGVAYNVSISYGTNQSACIAINGTINIANNVTSSSVWHTDILTGTLFDEATQYFYRLRLVGDDSSIQHSTMSSFTTWDSSIPPWLQQLMQWINDTFGTTLDIETIEWWVVGLLMLGAWFVAGMLKWKWVGVMGTGAIFIWLVVNEMVPVWVVILAVLIAGWIIFKMVYRRAGATGE